MKSAVSAASSSQVLALVVQLAWVTFMWVGLLSTVRTGYEQPKVSPAPEGRHTRASRPF
jgi:hypothetical protein